MLQRRNNMGLCLASGLLRIDLTLLSFLFFPFHLFLSSFSTPVSIICSDKPALILVLACGSSQNRDQSWIKTHLALLKRCLNDSFWWEFSYVSMDGKQGEGVFPRCEGPSPTPHTPHTQKTSWSWESVTWSKSVTALNMVRKHKMFLPHR